MKSILILFDNVISLYIWILIINVIISDVEQAIQDSKQ